MPIRTRKNLQYFKKIRKVLTNYPPVSKNLRVYLDPEICGIDEDYATSTQSVVTIVDTMDESKNGELIISTKYDKAYPSRLYFKTLLKNLYKI